MEPNRLPKDAIDENFVARFYEQNQTECRYLYLTFFRQAKPIVWASNHYYPIYTPEAKARGIDRIGWEDNGMLSGSFELYPETIGVGEPTWLHLDLIFQLTYAGFFWDKFIGERLICDSEKRSDGFLSYSEFQSIQASEFPDRWCDNRQVLPEWPGGKWGNLKLSEAAKKPEEVQKMWEYLRAKFPPRVYDDNTDVPF